MSATKSAASAIDERFERLPIDLVIPSTTNPRTRFDDAYLAELAGSIADKGVVQPILVREQENKKHAIVYEIIAGECRYRASLLAKQTHIPAIVREYSDEQVLELQLIENIHRQDLSPMDEARGYRALIDANPTKHSAASIATRIGMSPAWVWDRLKLNDLIPEAKKILDLGLMTVGHAILIARLKVSDQERAIAIDSGRNSYNSQRDGLWQFHGGKLALDDEPKGTPGKYDDVKAVTVRELEDWIRDHVRFDVEHAAKAQPLVFEETAAIVTAAADQPGRGKKVIPITFSYRVADDARDGDERTYGSESWKLADGTKKSKTCDHSVLGVVAAGDHYGETLTVCVARDKCLVHFGDVVRAKQKAEKQRAAGKGKQAAKTEKRAEVSQESRWAKEDRERRAAEKIWAGVLPEAGRLLLAHLGTVAFDVALVQIVFNEPYDGLASLADVKKDFGVVLTKKTAALVLALGTIRTDDRDQFAQSAKAWKFNMKPVDALITAQRHPAGEPVKVAAKGKKTKKSKAA